MVQSDAFKKPKLQFWRSVDAMQHVYTGVHLPNRALPGGVAHEHRQCMRKDEQLQAWSVRLSNASSSLSGVQQWVKNWTQVYLPAARDKQ